MISCRARLYSFAWSLSKVLTPLFHSSICSCRGLIRPSRKHVENCLSLASMLRCLMHILVNADPMSLVPPLELVARSATFWNASRKTCTATAVALSCDCSFPALVIKSSQIGQLLFMSPMTVWKSPPRALHSFSITASIFQDQLQWSVPSPLPTSPKTVWIRRNKCAIKT